VELIEKEKFKKREIADFIVSVIVLSAVFSVQPRYSSFKDFVPYFVFVSVILGLRQIVYRIASEKLRLYPVYKAWYPGMVVGLLLSFFGIKFAAPGFVVLYPYAFGRWGMRRKRVTVSEDGLISFFGSMVDLGFAVISKAFVFPFSGLIYEVSAWMFLSNLIPVVELDGSKIVRWKMDLWIFLVLVGIMLMII